MNTPRIFYFSDAQDCTPTVPSNGAVTPTTVTDGSDATYTCDSGYTLDGTSPLTCSSGNLGTEPTCESGKTVSRQNLISPSVQCLTF